MNFSERYGFKKVREAIQIDSMDGALRNSLWSILALHVWNEVYDSDHGFDQEMKHFCELLWYGYFKLPVDLVPTRWRSAFQEIRSKFFECDWNEVYDFMEFVVKIYPNALTKNIFIDACNKCLEAEGSAYRLIDDIVTRITEEKEVAEIEEALAKAQGPIRTHLNEALRKLSDRRTPDYRNSIKESISAVESLVQIVLGKKGTLGQLIKKLKQEIDLHPALEAAFSNLYGYTSDEDGIRHAILVVETVEFAEAKFFLVVCSAFVNFVNAKIEGSIDKPKTTTKV